MKKICLYLLVGLALAAAPAIADVWDTASESDNDVNTDNELTHGTEQVHDLGVQPGPAADQDWYRVTVPDHASYEVVMDGTTGDLNVSFDDTQLDRLDAAGVTILQNHDCLGSACFSKRLGWRNATTAAELSNIRVSGQGCGTSCTTADQYTIRSRETTVEVARFNNAGSQVTILITQNASDVPINATFFYWSTSGVLLQTGTLTNFQPKTLNVFNTTSFGPLVGVGGHITVAHDGPYGTLNIKTVALEPSTGFSFDTPGVVRGF